jgi:prepilin-type processing-associated H-X9-DG protein
LGDTTQSTWTGSTLMGKVLSLSWKGPRSRHLGGANILFGDGSVNFAKESIDPSTWAATATRAGGEVIGVPF